MDPHPPLTAGLHVGARPPAPNSARERELAGRFADALEHGDTASVVALLTADAWLTMPPEPHHYQGHVAMAAFLEDRALRRGRALRVIPTRALDALVIELGTSRNAIYKTMFDARRKLRASLVANGHLHDAVDSTIRGNHG